MCRRFPGHVMVGLDALHGKVANRGDRHSGQESGAAV
jgi:hypothetical protein